MNQNQSLKLDAGMLQNFASLFIKLVVIVIVVYLFIMVINLLRDKFISKESQVKSENITNLLLILNKLFFISGFGFVIGNILQMLLSQISYRSSKLSGFNLTKDWDYLTFGIIIIFIGIAFKVAYKMLTKENSNE